MDENTVRNRAEAFRDKKIVFMGTPDFSVGALSALVEAGYNVAGVVTQPDKPKGRSKTPTPTPVKEEALKYGIPVYQPRKVRDPEFVSTLAKISPDLIVVAAFGQIIPKSILDMPPFGCINIHASLLPEYRGAAPIQHAVIDGKEKSGVTIMKMDEGLDTGDMIAKTEVPITEEETGGSLFEKLSAAGASLLLVTLPTVFDGTAVYEKQPMESPTPYAGMIKKEMGLLDFTKEAPVLERLVRGMDPWPGAFTGLEGKTLKVWKSRVFHEEENTKASGGIPCGTVIKTDSMGIHVACGGDTVLVLTEVQLEGKKRMPAADFLRGMKIETGTVLKQ